MPDQNGVVTLADFPGLQPPDATTVKRFEYSITPLPFYLNHNLLWAVPVLPLAAIAKVGTLDVKALKGAETLEKILDVMAEMLLDESGQLLRQMSESKTNPVGMKQVMDVINWLLEVYGMRPTGPSADSSDTSENADGSTPLTAGASAEG